MKRIKSLLNFGLGCGLLLGAVAVPAVAAPVQATALPARTVSTMPQPALVAQAARPDAAAARMVRAQKLSAETRAFLAQWQSLQAKSGGERDYTYLQEQYGLRPAQAAADAQSAGAETAADAASAAADAAARWMLPVWLTFQSEAVAEETLQAAEALGFVVQTRLKTICTGMIPVDRIEALAQLEGVRQVQCGQRAEIRLDRLRQATKTDSVQDFGALDCPQIPSFRGEGIVVGVVDVGMEYVHPNFYDPDDTSHLRIQRVWAQKRKDGNPPEGYDYGTEYKTEKEIVKAKYSKDAETHGTHVAGIATGSGAGTVFKGIASKSDIVMVPTTMNRPDILDGVVYIRDYAEEVGKPCVVNLSIGGHTGPHDGTSAFDRALDELKAPGFVVVGAAGNEGRSHLYLGHAFDPATGDTILYTGLSFYRALPVEVWSADSLPMSVEVFLLRKADGTKAGSTGFYAATATEEQTWNLEVAEGSATVTISGEKNEFNGKYHIFIDIDSRKLNVYNDGSAYRLCLAVKTGRPEKPVQVDMWAANGEFVAFEHPSLTGIVGGSNRHTVGEVGGTSRSILTVGSFNTRNQWTSLDGRTTDHSEGCPLDALSDFSSLGPSVDGRVKPEITAPGAFIVSSYNSEERVSSDEQLGEAYRGGKAYPFCAMSGTSMATPAVTGMVALCLQVRPDWQVDSLRHYLALTAINDEFTGDARTNPSAEWGYGKIDILALLTEALKGATHLPAEEIREAVEGRRMLVYPNPSDGRFNVLLPLAAGRVRLQVVDYQGRVVYERMAEAGSPVAMTVPGLSKGMYVVRAVGLTPEAVETAASSADASASTASAAGVSASPVISAKLIIR